MSAPITLATLNKIETCVKNCLKWLIDSELADDCSVFAYSNEDNLANLDITITEPNGINIYSIIWEKEKLKLVRR